MKKLHLIGLAIAVAALYFTFRNISYSQLKGALASAEYIYLIPAWLIVVSSYLLRALRWKYLIKPIKNVSTVSLLSPLMIGFMGNLLPARAGEFIRAYVLGKKIGIGFSSSFGTVFIERIFDLVILLLLVVWMVLFKSDLFASITILNTVSLQSVMSKFGWITLGAVLGLILFCYLLLHAREKVMHWIQFLTRPFPDGFRLKVHELIHSFVEGLHILKDASSLIIVFFLSVLVWASIILSYYPFYYSFGIQSLPFSSLTIMVVITSIFITVFPSPGYLGSFQLACVVALYNIYGVPEPVAVSFGILTWFIMMLVVALWGSFCIMKGLSISELKNRSEESV
ncbi:MAG: lysylphosphatidylglycerol synthase transmembrane domain-containing protein [Nitrospinota bacterium]